MFFGKIKTERETAPKALVNEVPAWVQASGGVPDKAKIKASSNQTTTVDHTEFRELKFNDLFKKAKTA
jgi:hypothetical protein